jgi:glycosyltransferase involved in cell wall biosynthesis
MNGARAAHNSPSLWQGPGPHLLAVGRLVHEKGFDLLLEAFARVRCQFPQADLTIAGEGSLRGALEAQAWHLGIHGAVRFTGYVDRPYRFYPGATLFVLSSRREGMPNALLEAAAAGLPLVALPASGGLVDLVAGRSGVWLAPAISASALAETLLAALQALEPGQGFDHSFLYSSARDEHYGGFSFAQAIEAYDALIDATCGLERGVSHVALSHIALLIPGLERIGGAERQLLLLARGLRRRGWRVSVIALSGRGAQSASWLAAEGVAFLSLEMRKGLADPRGWVRFHRWVRRERPDVIHAHLPHATWLARWSRLAAPVPVVIDTLHSSAIGGIGRRIGYRLSGGLADRVTAVSEAAAEAHLRARMVRPETLTVVPNGVDVQVFRPDASARTTVRRELGLGDDFVWIAAGRLEPVKDYPTLLHAMAALPELTRLFIAGSGLLEQELRSLSASLGLDGRVCWLGFVPNVERLMQAADGFVLSSLWEGLPTALLEAAACALPAVATDVPGTGEAVIDGETGFLISPRDSAALASGMARLIQIPYAERRSMGARARQRVIESFSLDAVLDRWEQVYRGATTKGSMTKESRVAV